jgi:hypothetical protein
MRTSTQPDIIGPPLKFHELRGNLPAGVQDEHVSVADLDALSGDSRLEVVDIDRWTIGVAYPSVSQ